MMYDNLKIGMKVKATCDKCVYGVTNKENK